MCDGLGFFSEGKKIQGAFSCFIYHENLQFN